MQGSCRDIVKQIGKPELTRSTANKMDFWTSLCQRDICFTSSGILEGHKQAHQLTDRAPQFRGHLLTTGQWVLRFLNISYDCFICFKCPHKNMGFESKYCIVNINEFVQLRHAFTWGPVGKYSQSLHALSPPIGQSDCLLVKRSDNSMLFSTCNGKKRWLTLQR